MKKSNSIRAARLLPAGIPRYVRCYDNNGETADRYTVIFTKHKSARENNGFRAALAMNAAPFHPQGIGMHTAASDGNAWGFAPAIGGKNHLGTRIAFDKLPTDCQRLALQDYCEIWQISREDVRAQRLANIRPVCNDLTGDDSEMILRMA